MSIPASKRVPSEPAPGLRVLRNVVRRPGRTCGVCATPVNGYGLCWPCRDRRCIEGLADLVVPLAYAVDGTESAAGLRNFKNHPRQCERERCGSIVREALRLGTSLHEQCVGVAVGQPVSARVVIPSLTSRLGVHPMTSIAESLGLMSDVALRPALDARCDRVVDPEKFTIHGAVKGRHVLVIDDVWTTGSNAQSAALSIRRAGAAAVSIMVIARWLSPHHPLTAKFIRERLQQHYDPLVCPVTGDHCP
ncbi:ComF family protein [Mycolicibacterium moriokaense]|uniref:Amidophosphoribosyltransferase n=1 Tax=Mycolicibacterium moriokaense TaxID=39691 RepID=A0A318HJJ7_9MYCO|nr:phosphoribosyltransferase [Mycolicibacterium moriokaense]PXX01534.1 hypothetical protein C8E89_12820 [Mycolicibacterium moriokaense]